MEEPWTVYIARCADDTLYCGITNDLTRRIEIHNAGKGAKYTRSRLPIKVIFTEEGHSHRSALMREYGIKSLTLDRKLQLIEKSNVNKIPK